MHPAVPIALVFVGCCSNVVFLEYLVREYPGSGNLITFTQFFFISLEGFIFTTKLGRKAPVIPMRVYMIMVAMFFVVQVVNNYAYNFNIPMPLHMIFRAGSLIANLVLGVIILKRSYKPSKYVSVIIISIGICICTLMSVSSKSAKAEAEDEETEEGIFKSVLNQLFGVGMLTFALFMSARMGIYQEVVYKEHGKHPNEALFYNHALPLPGFLLLSSDIYKQILLFNQSTPMLLPVLEYEVPSMWVYLFFNTITQYICIRSVFVLTTECTSLTVTLVVTLRKFISLIFSIVYFKNSFTIYHWIGTVMVFGGTLIFTDTISNLYNYLTAKKKED